MPYRDDKKWEWTESLCEDGILNRGRKNNKKRSCGGRIAAGTCEIV